MIQETLQALPLKRVDRPQKILFINNKDSFVYNLVDYIYRVNTQAQVRVVENTIAINEVKEFNPEKIFISPGPGHPKHDTNNVIPIIQEFYTEIPIFGICLGHQAICEAFGEDPDQEYVGKARVGPMHGKQSEIFHNGRELFENIPNPCTIIRYHSLAAKADYLSQELKITAIADDGTIQAIAHKEYPVFGVQFHPESIMMKPYGIRFIYNFLTI